MKRNFIARLCAICITFSIALGLGSCDLSSILNSNVTSSVDNSSNDISVGTPNSGETSEISSDLSETTSDETSDTTDNETSDTTSSDEEPEQKDVHFVSETEWKQAFSPKLFVNVTSNISETQTDGTNTAQFTSVSKIDGTKIFGESTEDGSTTVMYISKEGEKTYMYTDAYTGTFTKVDVSSWMNFEDFSPTNETTHLVNLYSSFTYNEQTKSYSADRIQPDPEDNSIVLEDMVIKFEDGKILSYQYTTTTINEGGETITSFTKVTFSNYGTTTVTLPTIEEIPDVAGDGKISQAEWEKALSLDAFKDVMLTITMESSIYKMVLKYDDNKPNNRYVYLKDYFVDDDGVTQTMETTQYYVKNGDAYVAYVSVDGGDYIQMPIEKEVWEDFSFSRQVTLHGFEEYYIDDYNIFNIDGLTATLETENFYIQLVFNNQEQLISYRSIDRTDGSHLYMQFSSYGTTSITLPTNYTVA